MSEREKLLFRIAVVISALVVLSTLWNGIEIA